ncbi:TlpA disulfide reductase family protein [Olivibacter sp. XZL3]|uniref:TlpA family protein disulfide reductase n=1 Tax=Olivibacter sp. XZL3 TaxID=1735116 RepID=UPI001066CBEF|nr:TlpA disulfide reductase family protein [Olivibacter sp. XZL3]
MNDKYVTGLLCLKIKLLNIIKTLINKYLQNKDKRHNRLMLDCVPAVGRITKSRDEQPVYSTDLGRTTARRDERLLLAGARRRTLVMSDELSVRSLPVTYAQRCLGRLRIFSYRHLQWFGIATWYVECVWWNADKIGQNAEKALQIAEKPGQNAEKAGWNTLAPRRNALNLSCAFRRLFFVFTHMLGRTNSSRDERLILACAPRRAPLVMSDELSVMSLLLPDVGRNVGEIWRDALTERPNASAGRRNAKKIRRNAKKFRRNARFRDERPIKGQALRALKPYAFYLITLKILFCVCLAHAQQSSAPEAAHGVALSSDSIKPLQIGDTIPDELWNLPLKIVEVGQEGSPTITLADYKGKLIILDFWATWCSNCLAAIPKVEDLQEQFQQVLQVLPLTYENAVTALPTMQRNEWKLPSIMKGEIFKKYFPHRFIPHYVWIKDGYVYAITASEELTAKNIQKALHSTAPVLKEKRDLARNPFIPIDRYAAEQGAKIWKRSALTGFIEGTGGSGHHIKADTQVFYQFNRPIVDIYRGALACDYNRILIETTDSAKVLNRDFKKENLYAYQLLLPRQADGRSIQQYAVHDLNTAFGLHGHWEPKKRAVYSIKEMSNRKSTVKDGMPLSKLLKQLNYAPQWRTDLPIFLSECAIDRHVSLPEAGFVLRDNIPKLKDVLAANGLILLVEQRQIPMFILSDNRN